MSGIAAIIHFDGRPVAPGDVDRMTASMAYRGPDGIRHLQGGPVALGHCRLCTTTESLEEVQPAASASGKVWLVLDGWLDNWVELRAELLRRGATLRNRSDAELVLAAYELWGEDCVLHIEGDFALVVWDEQRQAVFCARDRMGNKPLNFFWTGKSLVIASEVRAILALPWVPHELNEGLLAERLAGEWWSRSETLWKGLTRLVAAHRMTVTSAGIRMDRYWTPDLETVIRYKSDEEYFQHYRELFLDRVRRSARSHRPVAYDVSGGLDSSAIFCAARHLQDRRQLPAPEIRGYTMDFSGDPRADEIDYVRAVARFLKTDIAEIAPTDMPLPWYVANSRESGEQAPYPNSVMMYGVRQAAVQAGSRVVIVGNGGDEWQDGSRAYYAEELAAGRLRNLFACLGFDLRSIGPAATLHAFLRHGIFPLLPTAARESMRGIVRQVARRYVPDADWLAAGTASLARSRRSLRPSVPAARTVPQRQMLELLYQEVVRDWFREVDERQNARLGLEGRRPMDTPALLQFALSTPERLRMRGDRSKFMHVSALRRLVP
ncbi:MAG: asparagine synthase-related protein, partial [Ramlibacter sp.]|nr:asparagine synthase-related protein [Ramlibacter sp.]